MDSSPTCILADDLIARIFWQVSSWNDVLALTLLCQQLNYVRQKHTINLLFQINAHFSFEKITVPSTMTKIVLVDCSISTEKDSFDGIVKSFTRCFVLGINFNDLDDLTTIEKYITQS